MTTMKLIITVIDIRTQIVANYIHHMPYRSAKRHKLRPVDAGVRQ